VRALIEDQVRIREKEQERQEQVSKRATGGPRVLLLVRVRAEGR